jgi:hypothetical protein
MMKPVTKSAGGARPSRNHATLRAVALKPPTCRGAIEAITVSPSVRRAVGTVSDAPVY